MSTREFRCDTILTVVARLGGGSITVVAEERDTALVKVDPHDGSETSATAAQNTVVDLRGDRLHIEAPENTGGFLLRRSGRLRIDIRVPLDTNVQLKTGSADLFTEGRLGDVHVNSGSGDVRVAGTSGGLSVNTGSGDVRADLVGGDLRVNGASSDLMAGRVMGEILATLASGDVMIEDAAGAVRVNTASGDIRLNATRTGQIHINSASGDVSVGVVTGTRVWLDLSTVSGSTTSELEMSGGPEQQAGPAATLHLQVRTMSGDIHVRRVYAPQYT